MEEDQDIVAAQQKRGEEWRKLADSYQKIDSFFQEEWTRVRQGREDLKAKREALVSENDGSEVSDSDILDINAGGEIIRVSRGTLTQMKGTFLEAIFSGLWDSKLPRDSSGKIFLDVNPTCFRCVVDYLNEFKLAPPENPPELPNTDPENQASLDRLCVAFGLMANVALEDSEIVTKPEHTKALTGFLEEDGVSGHFELLYRGTRDGMNPKAFHEKCDDKGPILVIGKSTHGYIFGGYSGIPWQGGDLRWAWSDESFLFSLDCFQCSEPMKMKPIPNGAYEKYALCFACSRGPAFGAGHDLAFLMENSNRSESILGHTYQDLAELEVFSIDATRPEERQVLAAAFRNNTALQPQENPELASIPMDNFPDSLRDAMKNEKESLSKANAALLELNGAFDQELCAVKQFCRGSEDEIVYLNVSGCSMAVSHSTLELFPDSVLYKQFVDPNWNISSKPKHSPAQEWTPDEVKSWVQSLGCSVDVSDHFSDVNGAEFLSLKREDIKDLGIARPGSVALLTDSIQKLRDEEASNAAAFVEHSPYCMGKILDHMRLLSMAKLGIPAPATPTIRDAEKERFKRIVEYYFPTEEMASKFLG